MDKSNSKNLEVVSSKSELIAGTFLGVTEQENTFGPYDVAEILAPDGSRSRVIIKTQAMADHVNSLEEMAEVRVLRTTRQVKQKSGRKVVEKTQVFHDFLKAKAVVHERGDAEAESLER